MKPRGRQGVSGLLVITVGAAFAIVAAAMVTWWALAFELSRCYLDVLALPDRPICGAGVWVQEWVPFAVMGLGAATFFAALALLGFGVKGQFGGAGSLRRRLAAAEVPPPPALARCAARVGLEEYRCVSSASPWAITIGCFAPQVVVSDRLVDLLDDAELEAVLAHEQEHQRRRHPAIFGLARAAGQAAFALPVARTLASRVVLAAEIGADTAAVGESGVAPLVAALAKLSGQPDPAPEIALGSVRGMLDYRVRALAGLNANIDIPGRVLATSMIGAIVVAAPLTAVVVAYLRVRGVWL